MLQCSLKALRLCTACFIFAPIELLRLHLCLRCRYPALRSHYLSLDGAALGTLNDLATAFKVLLQEPLANQQLVNEQVRCGRACRHRALAAGLLRSLYRWQRITSKPPAARPSARLCL